MRTRSWTTEQLKQALSSSHSYRQILFKLHLIPAGGNYKQIKKYIQELRLPIEHLTGKGWNKGLRGIGKPLLTLQEILQQNTTFQSYKLKKRLYEAGLKEKRCEECGWHDCSADGRIPLELDHINGDNHDNRIDNLRILCPNCHSLKPTHRGKNRKRACAGIGRQPTLKMLW